MPPLPGPRAAALGAILADLGILTAAQWRQALDRGGSARDALGLLSRVRAHWCPADAPEPTFALTPYQAEQIGTWLDDPGAPAERLAARLLWNDYLLLQSLGEGGMGQVFKGWERGRARYVAIKRTLVDAADLRRRLVREAELLRLLNHPHIARFYSLEPYAGRELLVMEYVPGTTLDELIRQRKGKSPAPWEFVATLGVALLDALDHAHGNNPRGVVVVHRDVKPTNVMLQAVGREVRPKLLDVGLGKAIAGDFAVTGDAHTRQFQILGTPEYMAPELWEGGDQAVPASDVYGLGGTLYFALTGAPPFGLTPSDTARVAAMAEMARRHGRTSRPSPAAARPDVPPALDALVRRMLSVAPADRGTAGELRDEFRKLLAAPRPPAAPVRRGPPAPRSSASHPRLTIVPPAGEYEHYPLAEELPPLAAAAVEPRVQPDEELRPAGPRGRAEEPRAPSPPEVQPRTLARRVRSPLGSLLVVASVLAAGLAAGPWWATGLALAVVGVVLAAHAAGR